MCRGLISLVHTCKRVDVNPATCLEHAIRAIDTTPALRIHELTPWAYTEQVATADVTA